jgi:hypothetical protein
VTERAWKLYLRERGQRDVEPGSLRHPAVVGEEFGEELLLGFATWLGTALDDGYEYSIPTPEQWRASFLGSQDPTKAAGEIENWFTGYYPGWKFTPRTAEFYGTNYVLPCGSRKENQTVTGLLDMESNLQEVVRSEDGRWWVIGGWNTLRSADLRQQCVKERELQPSLKDYRRRFTGFRVGRRLKSS